MKRFLAVGVGGMLGALARAGIFEAISSTAGLWAVNLFGSFVIGYAAARFHKKSAEFRLFISTGFVGSFTTFSAFSAQWFSLLEAQYMAAIGFALAMTAASVLMAAGGLAIGRQAMAK
ncbi:fluoride efflux transporter FluC [Planococcus ruber]|uniref:fluoride efflux transporter FluC n=1 Tax=Planococcus ruber TaxID=2027871 RepID=UPI001FEE2FBC|nr:CrcB family protein [Planococcus ruber]